MMFSTQKKQKNYFKPFNLYSQWLNLQMNLSLIQMQQELSSNCTNNWNSFKILIILELLEYVITILEFYCYLWKIISMLYSIFKNQLFMQNIKFQNIWKIKPINKIYNKNSQAKLMRIIKALQLEENV